MKVFGFTFLPKKVKKLPPYLQKEQKRISLLLFVFCFLVV